MPTFAQNKKNVWQSESIESILEWRQKFAFIVIVKINPTPLDTHFSVFHWKTRQNVDCGQSEPILRYSRNGIITYVRRISLQFTWAKHRGGRFYCQPQFPITTLKEIQRISIIQKMKNSLTKSIHLTKRIATIWMMITLKLKRISPK